MVTVWIFSHHWSDMTHTEEITYNDEGWWSIRDASEYQKHLINCLYLEFAHVVSK